MADYGIKISKSGFDVGTASNKDLAFSSSLDTLKVYSSGSINMTAAGTATATHNLGYIPSFTSFAKFNGGQHDGKVFSLPAHFPSFFSKFIHAGTDTLKIVIESLPGTATSIDVKYVIFINQML